MKLTDDWESFDAGPPERPENRIHVTLNRMGTFLLNRNAYRLLGSPEALVFHYSRKREMIAVTSTHRRNTKGFLLVPRRGINWCTQISNFCRHHRIRVDNTIKFAGAEIDDDGMLILDLKNTVSVALTRTKVRRSKS